MTKKQTVPGKIDRFFKRLKKFINVISYVGKQNFIAPPTANIYAASLLVFGGLLQVLALLLITFLLSGDANKTSLLIPSFPLATWLEASSMSFMQTASLLTSIFVLSAFCTYWAETRVLKLATELELKLSKNLFNYLGTKSGAMQIIEKKHSLLDLIKILTSSTRLAGRVLRLQYALIQPLLKAMVLLGMLLMMDWGITLSILGFIFLLGIVQYNINLRAVKYSNQFEQSNTAARRLVKSYLESALLNLGSKSEKTHNFFYEEDILLNKKSYQMRVQVTEESMLMSNLAKAVIIFFLLATITEFGMLQSQQVMETLLSYALVLLVFLLSIRSTLACLTNISRFYPQLSRYINLVCGSCPTISALDTNCLFIPIFSKQGKPLKLYLRETALLLIVCPPSQVANTHIGILSSIIKGSPQKSIYQSIDNEKDFNLKNKLTPLLPHSTATSAQEITDFVKNYKNNSLHIIYIMPSSAKELADTQPLYEYSHKMTRLEPWSNKFIPPKQFKGNLEEDDLDEI